MKYSVDRFIKELTDNQVITNDTASKIQDYFAAKSDPRTNRLLAIFGVLGALLIGIGIILIVAHNWDDFTRTFKAILAFVPVLIGLGACGFAIFKKENSYTWKEGSAVFLTFAFGACMALISQIYNIPGTLQDFMLTWIIAIIPLVYIMWSSITSILLIIGITAFGAMAGYENVSDSEFQKYLCWVFLAALVPFYWTYWKRQPTSNALYFHHWLLPGSIIILLGTLFTLDGKWAVPAYIALFGCYYLFSGTNRLQNLSLFANGYRLLSSLGTVLILMFLSFRGFWEEMIKSDPLVLEDLTSTSFVVTMILAAAGVFMLYQRKFKAPALIEYTFLVFIPVFLIGYWSSIIPVVTINILILVFSVFTISKGVHMNHLGVVNYGLLCITALIACRFFDIDIPFFMKGLIFIFVGFAFFYSNYRMIQGRKSS
ncbi:MAG: DUF2157 domain-containing protein [Bacteroidia bacterium]|nr:DUF2157 domain-containing protein [Bacteroidia bacterium]